MNKYFGHITKQVGKLLFVPVLALPMMFAGLGAVNAQAAEQEPVIQEEYTLDRVNFRMGPSTDSPIIDVLDFGTPVLVEMFNPAGWSVVTCNGHSGYVLSEYIGDKAAFDAAAEQAANRTVELTPWSEAKNIFDIGANAEIYDCYSGEVYYVRSFSNGSHADVEPVTTQDTAVLKSTFGGVWSWDVRPVWVTINGHTMAASINGMPHGGGVNSGNGMDGQVCIHFLGSTVHNGNWSFAQLHQDVLQEAYAMGN